MSETMKQYIAGQLYCLPYIMPMYAPSVNSYKRYVEGAWAATSVSWALRTERLPYALLIMCRQLQDWKQECPVLMPIHYLSLAASLASGLYGIKHTLTLDLDAVKGSAYDNRSLQHLPSTLQEATAMMKTSGIATELFGKAFVDHFIRTREWEWQQFSKQVTDWELKRYFEII